MPRIVITTPRVSNSASALYDSLNEVEGNFVFKRRANRTNQASPRGLNFLINWGCGGMFPDRFGVGQNILNPHRNVSIASNKVLCLQKWERAGVPNVIPFTSYLSVAQRYLQDGLDSKVYCRTQLRGHSGEGIVIARNVGELVDAPLYTYGVDTRYEFRVHVMDGQVIDAVRKGFTSDIPSEERNRDIMNHAAGTTFFRSGRALEALSNNSEILQNCVLAVTSLGLDFGAVDIIEDREGNFHILEVNTACGLEGTTLTRYTRAFNAIIRGNPVQPWDFSEFQAVEEPVNPLGPEGLEVTEVENLTQSIETTQEERNIMELSQVVVGQSVTFNPEASNQITRLTRGTNYVVESVGNTVIRVRGDDGTIRPYQSRHFSAAPVAPAAPAVELTANDENTLDLEQEATSPLRVCRLEDDTEVNCTGRATFLRNIDNVEQGEHQIVEIRQGEQTGNLFIGIITGQSEELFFFPRSYFGEGEINLEELPAEYDQPDAPNLPRANDVRGQRLVVGSKVQVATGTGGHGVPVGTVGTLVSISDSLTSINFEGVPGNTEILPSRVRKINQRDFDQVLQDQQLLQQQSFVTVVVDGNSFRVPNTDLHNVMTSVRRYSV